MKNRMVSLLLCLLLLLCSGADALAAQHCDPGFYDVGQAAGVVIEPLSSSEKPVKAESIDADGDGDKDEFYPNSVMLRVTIPDAESGKQYMIQVRDAETGEILCVDQKTGGSSLRFRVSFLLPERCAELKLMIGSSADGFSTLEIPLCYTPGAAELTPPAGYADCPRDESCPMTAFSDLDPAAWYHDGVHWALESGVMNGVGSSRFDPSGTTSRAMIVTMIWRMEGEPEGGGVSFRDVPDGAWYSEAVGWAASEHIVDGYGPDRFGPDDSATREQLAAILWRYAKYKGVAFSIGVETDLSSFEDAFSVSSWAVDAIRWACGAGIIQGTGNGRISPKLDASRAQVATMLMRFSDIVAAQRDLA